MSSWVKLYRNFLLTSDEDFSYTESLKLVIPAFAPVRFAIFLYLPMARTRAENNQYQPSLYYSFSESSPLSYLAVLSKKVIQMTNTIINTSESTLQALYRYYSEMKSTWYKGNYTIEQEDIYYSVFSALEKALLKLPAQSSSDTKIKLSMLKKLIQFPLETNDGIDLNLAENREVEALELIEQIAAE